ncbi:MAG: DUF4160 domain-containing protein [Rhodocyclales bacterium]|nr:DUF4160 domain-containing protein [Rhodocyclales bacterium]
MPRIRPFAACQINLYPKDHLPPHFHVVASDGREWLVRIEDGEILEGPRDVRAIREALEWAAVPENRELLMRRFLELRS